MDITGGLESLGAIAAGLNQGLSSYMQNDLNMQMKTQAQDAQTTRELSKVALEQQFKSQNTPKLSLGKLKQINPMFGKVFAGADDNTMIGLDEAKTMKGLEPAPEGADANRGISVDAYGDFLKMGGADPDEVDKTVASLKKHGANYIPTGMAEMGAKNMGGDTKTASIISLVASDPNSAGMTPMQKTKRVKDLRKILNGKGTKEIPDDQVDTFADASMKAYEAAQAQGQDGEIAVASELANRYTDDSVSKVLMRLAQRSAAAQGKGWSLSGAASWAKGLAKSMMSMDNQ